MRVESHSPDFFCILGYLEGEFSPTGPRHPILGAGFAWRCPGNGRMLKKMKTGQNSLRNSLRVGPPMGGGSGGEEEEMNKNTKRITLGGVSK